jgi:tetratricopeptide (TPR) repeat protein
MTPCLFSAQFFKYQKIKPEKGHLIQTVPYEKWLKRNYCGPACLAMVPNSRDETRSFSQAKIADEIYDSGSQATSNSELVLYPRIISLRQGQIAEAEAYALQAVGLDAKSAYAKDVLGLAYANQGRMVPALQSLGQALRPAPKDEFIRKYYLQVRALYIDKAGGDAHSHPA